MFLTFLHIGICIFWKNWTFFVFLTKLYVGKAKFIENEHFMNRSITRHLNEHKKCFEHFYGFSAYPPEAPKIVKNLEFSRFYHIFGVLGPFV
jgi:hypothetical protein